jgi:DNA primase
VDVITAHQHGFRNVVAPLGTAITRGHVALLKRLSHNVYMALDADAAGQRATLKGLNAINESTEESELTRATISGQGEVLWESDIVLRVIKMPKGKDPDEVIRSDPELWRTVVNDAKPVIDFLIEINIADLDVTKSDDLRVALDRLTPILSKLDDRQQRVYSTVLERITGVRADILLAQLKEPARKRPTKQPRPLPAQPRPAVEQPAPDMRVDERRTSLVNPHENYLLSLALRYSLVVPAAVEALLEQSLEKFPAVRELLGGGLEDLLEDPANQQIWAAFTALPIEGRPTGEEALRAWANWLEEPLRERFLAVLDSGQRHPEDFRYRQVAEDYARSLRREQALRLQRMLLDRMIAAAGDPVHEQTQIVEQRQFAALGQFIAESKTPPRTSTFLDLRDRLGRQ